MIEVTMSEWVILTFIRDYCNQHGRSPLLNEIEVGCNRGRDSVRPRLMKLSAKGLLLRRDTGYRNIVLTDKPVAVIP